VAWRGKLTGQWRGRGPKRDRDAGGGVKPVERPAMGTVRWPNPALTSRKSQAGTRSENSSNLHRRGCRGLGHQTGSTVSCAGKTSWRLGATPQSVGGLGRHTEYLGEDIARWFRRSDHRVVALTNMGTMRMTRESDPAEHTPKTGARDAARIRADAWESTTSSYGIVQDAMPGRILIRATRFA